MNYSAIHEVIHQNAVQNKRFAGLHDKDMKKKLNAQVSYETIPLHQVTSSFFEPNSLRRLVEESIYEIDRQGYKNPNKKIPKYYLTFGNHYGLDAAKKNSQTFHGLLRYPKPVTDFIVGAFDKQRDGNQSIIDSYEDSNNRVFIILERSTKDNSGTATKAFKYVDSIVAVLVCRFQESCCNLIWYASNNITHQKKGFASLLLATAQTCQEIIHGNDVIICQANINASVAFYLQHHFEIIPKENKKDHKECKEQLEKIEAWLPHKELRILRSRAKVNVLHTWMYEETMEADAFNQFIIPQLVKNYFPDVTELHCCNVDDKIFKNILSGINPTFNNEPFSWSSCLENDTDDDQGDEINQTVYASSKTLETLVNIDNCCIDENSNILLTMPEILPSHLKENDHTDDLFHLMSNMLYFQNSDHETDIRCFLGFLYSCFSVLHDNHPFLTYSKEDTKEASYNLQSINIRQDLCKRLEDEYTQQELFKYLQLDVRKFKDPIVMKMAFKLLKCHIIPYGKATKVRKNDKSKKKEQHVTFRGYPMDLVMFSTIICPRIYLFSAETNHIKDRHYNQRVWQAHIRLVPRLKCIDYAEKLGNSSDQDVDNIYLFGHTHNENFILFKMDRRMRIYTEETISVKSKYRAKAYEIDKTEPLLINKLTNEWLYCPTAKYFKNRKSLFTFIDFMDAKLKKQNYLPIVRIVDPLECVVKLFQDKYLSFTSRLNIKEFLAFQKETCLQDSGLEAFYLALKSSRDNIDENNRVAIIGPNKAKLLISMQNNVNDADFNTIKQETSLQKRLCIQINVGNHFITAEVDQVHAKKNNCWDVMVADSANNSEKHLEEINKGHLEDHGVLKYLRLLQPDYKIKIKLADNVTIQPNDKDCGVHGARRIYSYWKHDQVFPVTACDTMIMGITPFRLLMLEYILEQAESVSVYVSPLGKGSKYDNNSNEETSGRPIRTRSIKPPNPKPIPDGQKIWDVDARPDDDDKIGKQIEKDLVTHLKANLDFDRDLFTIISRTNIASTILEEPNITDNDTTMLTVDNDNIHQAATGVSDAAIGILTDEHSGNNELRNISKSGKHPHSSQNSPLFSSDDDNDTDSESEVYSNPKKPYAGKQARLSTINEGETADNESTDMESIHSIIKKKQNDVKISGKIIATKKNKQKENTRMLSPRSKNVTKRSETKITTINSPAKIIRIKNNLPSKKPKSQQSGAYAKRSTTSLRAKNDLSDDAIKKISGIAREAQINKNKQQAEAQKAIEEGYEWDLTKLKALLNYTELETNIDEPTIENQQILKSNRISELNAERLKSGQNELTIAEQENWEQHYYDRTQLDETFLTESLQNEVTADLRKAKAEEKTKGQSYQDSKKKNGELDKVTKRKYEQYVKAQVEVTMLQFELNRNKYFHPYNSIWSIRIDDDDVVDEKDWKYYVVFKSSDGNFYEAPVARSWLTDNLDPKYIRDLMTHCRSKKYILYDEFGAKLTKNFAPYIEHLPRDNNLKLLKPIYTYRPKEDDVRILRVRAIAKFSKSKQTPGMSVINERIRWAIYYTEGNTRASTLTRKYNNITISELCDIVDPSQLEIWKLNIKKWFADDNKRLVNQPMSLGFPPSALDDEDDKQERCIDLRDTPAFFHFQDYPKEKVKRVCRKCELGQYGEEAPYYWNTESLNLFINKTKTQIGGIRYCKNMKQFFGIEDDPITKKTKHVELSDSWVMENFDTKIITKIKSHSANQIHQGKLYYKVPIGCARDVNINNKWSHNPRIKYRQHDEGTCSFKSLSSAMSHLALGVEAALIDNFCNEFFNTTKFEEHFHRLLQEIITYIRKTDAFKKFRREYNIRKIIASHDLIKTKCNKNDIRLVILHADDFSINHAVSVADGFIFDSNCYNAMNLSHEALCEACNGNKFVSIYNGYLFEKKQK